MDEKNPFSQLKIPLIAPTLPPPYIWGGAVPILLCTGSSTRTLQWGIESESYSTSLHIARNFQGIKFNWNKISVEVKL